MGWLRDSNLKHETSRRENVRKLLLLFLAHLPTFNIVSFRSISQGICILGYCSAPLVLSSYICLILQVELRVLFVVTACIWSCWCLYYCVNLSLLDLTYFYNSVIRIYERPKARVKKTPGAVPALFILYNDGLDREYIMYNLSIAFIPILILRWKIVISKSLF